MLDDRDVQLIADTAGLPHAHLAAYTYADKALIVAPHIVMELPRAEVGTAHKFSGIWDDIKDDVSSWKSWSTTPDHDPDPGIVIPTDETVSIESSYRPPAYIQRALYNLLCHQYFRPTFHIPTNIETQPVVVKVAGEIVALVSPLVGE